MRTTTIICRFTRIGRNFRVLRCNTHGLFTLEIQDKNSGRWDNEKYISAALASFIKARTELTTN